jgi:hypothetical protein
MHPVDIRRTFLIAFAIGVLYLGILVALAASTFDASSVGSFDSDLDLPAALANPGWHQTFWLLRENLGVLGISVAYCVGLRSSLSWSRSGPLSRRTRIAMALLTVITLAAVAYTLYRNAQYLFELSVWSGLSPLVVLATMLLHAVPEITAYFLPVVAVVSALSKGHHGGLGRLIARMTLISVMMVCLAATLEANLWRPVVEQVVPPDNALLAATLPGRGP